MAIFEIKSDRIEKISEISFSEAGLSERGDLQRLLRVQIDVIAPDLLVISEEFDEWGESKRRIDLLALDKGANLVVIELKRTEDGGHMELQAIRYAAMIATMTFEQAVNTYQSYLRKISSDLNAQESLLEFLEWDEPDEDSFAQDVRLLLVSADFSKELTTSVIWLNERGMDIRCIRIKPYEDGGRTLIDVQQVIPLPEAEEYMVSIREKSVRQRIERAGKGPRHKLRQDFWTELLNLSKNKTQLFASVSSSTRNSISTGAGISSIKYSFIIRQNDAAVKFTMGKKQEQHNREAFKYLMKHRQVIENAFGAPLKWTSHDDLKKSFIQHTLSIGGNRNERSEWPAIQEEMIDAMVRLEAAISPHMDGLRSAV